MKIENMVAFEDFWKDIVNKSMFKPEDEQSFKDFAALCWDAAMVSVMSFIGEAIQNKEFLLPEMVSKEQIDDH